jgi:hypothetical protein
MIAYQEMKSLTSSQNTVLFRNLYNLRHPWGLWAEHKKIKCWVDRQNLLTWHNFCSVQRQGWKFISCSSLNTKTRFLYFNRTQSRVVRGHNTYRRHLHLMGMTCIRLWSGCWTHKENSTHILCQCQALASLRHTYLCCSFLDPEEIKSLTLVAV